MTDRRSTPDPDGELDAGLERRLRAAFAAASAPGAPETVHAEVSRLVSTTDVRVRARVGGRLSFAFAAVVVGLFVVLVGSLLSVGSGPSPSPSADASVSANTSVQPSVPSPSASAPVGASTTPTPSNEPTPWPLETMAPAADDVLPLAGRDGLPGRLYCSHHPFGFDGLTAPTGAEDRVGPEFDVLRATVARDGDNFWGEGGPDPTFREAGRDASGVVFLYDRIGTGPIEGGPYIYIEVASDEDGWRWEGEGDCQPRAVGPSGYGQATWTLDPDFRAPDRDTRTLNILVRELACASGRSASGRISPAFVTWDPYQLVIELFVETLPSEVGSCPAAPETPAKVRLPITLGDRTLFDAGTIGLGGSGG